MSSHLNSNALEENQTPLPGGEGGEQTYGYGVLGVPPPRGVG